MVKPLSQKQQCSPGRSSSPTACNNINNAAAATGDVKYKGVRKRKWGKYVSEIRLPNSRERIWLGSYDTAEKAARAFDAALYCLRGRAAKFNFPDNPPEIANGRSMTPPEIQMAASRFANSEQHITAAATSSSGRVETNSDNFFSSISSSSDQLFQVDSPSPSVSGGGLQLDSDFADIPLDTAFLDLFSTVGSGPGEKNINNVSDYGIFPGFDDFSGDLFVPPLSPVTAGVVDYTEEHYDGYSTQGSSYLWNF